MPVVSDNSSTTRSTYIGQAIKQFESIPLVQGRGNYADDLAVKPGTLYAAVYRSSHAHALIKSIDIEHARAMPGVRTILTPEDVLAWSKPFINAVRSPMELWALAIDRVRYVGEPILVVIAESRYQAEDALEKVIVDFEPLPAINSIERALAEDAPLLHEKVGSNIVHEREFLYGTPDTEFENSTHELNLTFTYPRNSCTPIECGVVIAEYLAGDEGYEVCSNFMGPFSMHAVMASALKVPSNRLRHRTAKDSGGSFGVKQAVFAAVVLMCLASRKAGGRPVKWVEDRLEHLSAATAANGRKAEVRVAFESDGRIRALEIEQFDDVGAYLRAPEPATLYRMHGLLTGAYRIEHVRLRNRSVVTNKMPSGLVRGFGGPQTYFVLERTVQRIAQFLGIDPLAIYRRNFVRSDEFPYSTAAGALLDSGDYHGLMELAVEEGGLEALKQRRQEARAQGRLYGIGYAAIVEPSISNMGYITVSLTPEERERAGPKSGGVAAATLSIDLLGHVVVNIASAPAGQGHATVCAQVVADVFGLEPKDIKVNVEFDTNKDAWSVAAGNYSSRFAGAVAGTTYLAAKELKEKMTIMAASILQCSAAQIVFKDGTVYSSSKPDETLSFRRLASSAHWSPAELPKGVEPGMHVTKMWSPETLQAPTADDRVNTSAAYGFVFDICAVEIDTITGRVIIDRYITAHDAGTLLNPALANGQIRGAFAQGLGAALYEEFQYGADGSFQSGTFADYLVPTSFEVPDPVILHMESPSPFTPLGAKGLAEGNNMSTPVCIANAVADALAPLGKGEDISLPLTPGRVMELIGIEDPPPSKDVQLTIPADSTAEGHMLSASGEVEISARPEDVFAVLLDPQALAKVIPGCKELKQVGAHAYEADVTIRVGMIAVNYQAKINLTEINEPSSLRLAGVGVSSLGEARGSGQVFLEEVATGTLLRYEYGAEVQGKIAAIGSRMLEGAARMVLNQLFAQLGQQASGQEQTGSGVKNFWQRLLRWLGRK